MAGWELLPLPVRSLNDLWSDDNLSRLLLSPCFDKTLPATVWKDERELQGFALDFIEEMCWGLGQGQTPRAQVETCLRQVKLLLE